MKIIPSADIGELGPGEGVPVTYNWKLYYNTPSLLLWVVIILAIVSVKENRDRRALLIILPLVIVSLLWFGFTELLNFPSSAKLSYGSIVTSFMVGISVLWLLAHKLVNRNRFVTFLLAFVLMAIVSILVTISYNGLELTAQSFEVMIILAILILAMLLGFVLAGWGCRKRYSGLRFVLYLAFGTVTVCLVSLLIYLVLFLFMQPMMKFSELLYIALIVGVSFGLFCFLINLPFLILGLKSTFFRERFFACLRIKPMPATTIQSETDGFNEQNSAKKASLDNNSS